MRLLAIAALLCGCKDAKPKPAPIVRPSPAAPIAPIATAPPLSIAEAAALLPKIDGDVLAPPRSAANGQMLFATWCVAGTSADAAARTLGEALAGVGWTGIASRGDARKAGVSGERSGYRASLIVSASEIATCAAPTHYLASATISRATP